jgi:diketogulonate reductase-like aldo/keto reductase
MSAATALSLTSKLPLPSNQGLIPRFGLGVFVSSRCEQSVLSALKAGYRHIDTAQIYYNEHETGAAVNKFLSQNPDVKRSDIFVTTKLWEVDLTRPDMPTSFDALCNNGPWPVNSLEAGHTTYSAEGVAAGVDRSLKASGLEYFDLFLLHNPRPGSEARLQAWLGLQKAREAGKVRAIGVSNWSPRAIEALAACPEVNTVPATNQIEFHPWNQQREILAYCQKKGIVVVAYSPLTQGKRLGDPTIVRIAEKLGKTPAQVVLRWCLQMGVSVIPKSDRDERILENKNLFDFELDSEDMKAIEALDEGQKGNLGEWDPFAWEN